MLKHSDKPGDHFKKCCQHDGRGSSEFDKFVYMGGLLTKFKTRFERTARIDLIKRSG